LEGLARERVDVHCFFSDAKVVKKRGKALEKVLPAATATASADEAEKWFLQGDDRSTLFEEREAVLRTADRAGLLACGSPLVAAEALKDAGRRERSRVHPLIEFASSRVFSSVLDRSG
jgi:hypothetical protein